MSASLSIAAGSIPSASLTRTTVLVVHHRGLRLASTRLAAVFPRLSSQDVGGPVHVRLGSRADQSSFSARSETLAATAAARGDARPAPESQHLLFDLGLPCLPEGIGHNALPETTIEEKDERVYAAWRLSSHRIASSISRGGRS